MKIKESKDRDKYLDLTRDTKKGVEHKGDGDSNFKWSTWNGPQRLGKGVGKVRNRRTDRDYAALLRSARILRRVLKTLGDSLSLRLTLVSIIRKQYNNNNNNNNNNIETDHPFQARRPDLVLINKKKRTCYQGDFAVTEDDRVIVKV